LTKLEQFLDKKYINLETYRKSGESVRTPVWFVVIDELIYVITRENTGKIKRIKNNPNVKIMPCTFNGKSTGTMISGQTNFVKNEEAEKAIQVRKKKYGFMSRFANFLTSQKGSLIVISVKIE
jgi:PPOX class probable F420-dependent enzyme